MADTQYQHTNAAPSQHKYCNEYLSSEKTINPIWGVNQH